MSVLPPDVPGVLTVEKLLSRDEILILERHYRAVSWCKSDDERNKALKGWGNIERKLANELYARLFANGFVVAGQDEAGKLHFGFRLKSEVQQIMELSNADYAEYRAGRIVFDPALKRLVRRAK